VRDVIVLLIVLISVPFSFRKPYVGVYMWYWIAFMNPHRLAWGFMTHFPLAQIVGIATIAGWLVFGPRRGFPISLVTSLLLLFGAAMTVSTYTAVFADAWVKWNEVAKILLMTFMTMVIIDDEKKLNTLILVVAGSVAFYALKGTAWGILTGAGNRLYGPERSLLADNNALALAFNMVLPVLRYLALKSQNRWLHRGFNAAAGCCAFGVLLTYSRGGMLGLVAVASLLVMKHRHRVVVALVSVTLGIVLFFAMPARWHERMGTIKTYDRDESAMSRLDTWQWALRYGLKHPVTGGGFEVFRLNPNGYNAHSIYFGTLAEQGVTGLTLFLALLSAAFLAVRRVGKMAKARMVPEWYGDCGRALGIGLVGFVVSGTFLNLQYFDLMYAYLAIIVCLRALASQREAEVKKARATSGREEAVVVPV